jgi:polyisoprenyl-teichoic acid--peptidoglycan teichoic acid transferase
MRAEKRKKKRKWVRVTGIVLLLLFLGAGTYAYSVYHSLSKAVKTMHDPTNRKVSEKRAEEVSLEEKQPFSVLMLGVDEREGDKGRSDTMIVLTVNPQLKTVKMLSIPRDTRVEIVGHGTEDKINHAYAFGNEEMAMATVENFLDIPIDYYIKVNMEGFQDIVDAVGGIKVNNSLEFSNGGVTFKEGDISLTGEEALSYVRMRYDDPQGDFGRQQRQRQIIRGVIREGASFSSLTNYDDIFSALGENVRTNLTWDQMVDIQKNYRHAGSMIDQLSIQGEGGYIGKVWYLFVSDEEKERIQQELKGHLEV